jgi:hypothetical protein
MEAITRLVSDSLARHGFNRPPDPRRLQWSRWFLCDSLHSLLVVPSKPGIFAIAEEIMNLETTDIRGAADDLVRSEASTDREGHDFISSAKASDTPAALAAEVNASRRMLAVLQFSEDDDMAFVLDRMFTRPNPMRERLASGHCFLRFVAIEDEDQRRSICHALNQWLLSSAERASGIPAGFSSSLEFTAAAKTDVLCAPPHFSSGANRNLHCPQPFPSGF